MFIPLEGEDIVCLGNVIAIYKSSGNTEILRRDGTITNTGFTPTTLKRRQMEFWDKSVITWKGFNING